MDDSDSPEEVHTSSHPKKKEYNLEVKYKDEVEFKNLFDWKNWYIYLTFQSALPSTMSFLISNKVLLIHTKNDSPEL